jgi:hypothetical protein
VEEFIVGIRQEAGGKRVLAPFVFLYIVGFIYAYLRMLINTYMYLWKLLNFRGIFLCSDRLV